jgi:hypothetical protein
VTVTGVAVRAGGLVVTCTLDLEQLGLTR